MIKKLTLIAKAVLFTCTFAQAQKQPVDFVNPFIGTTNYGTTNPGAVMPHGLMSASPFNVMGSDKNKFDKDKQWWSTPYDFNNKYLTGFSHVNLSGVGCPDLGSLLLMPTSGKLNVDYSNYGSTYSNEIATPGYYSNTLDKYGIKCEMTATQRTSRTRFTFPKGESNIIMNLGEGLTNESGATVKYISDTEIEGSKLLGTFCYNPNAVFPIYFVMRINKKATERGYWKKQRAMGVEADWDETAGKIKLYKSYTREMSGDDIGAWFSFDTENNEVIEVSIGVSFVSCANARLNLDTEQPSGITFDAIRKNAADKWNDDLSRIKVKGGTDDQKSIFYTAMYHTLIHPNILQDVNGEYPEMEGNNIRKSDKNRYTVFSLWDTYRNVHQFITLVYPARQMDMIHTMMGMYEEHGWFPKWELFGRETLTMEGDPSIPVIVDSWMKGLKNFDINKAYEGMYKSATTEGKHNLMRSDNDDYMKLGYVPMQSKYDNSVSHALEYYVADYALSTLAEKLNKKDDAKLFKSRAMGYKNYYCKEFGTLRPIEQNGKFYSPFDPKEGENFAPSPGFHEGNAWNYSFYVPFDIDGLKRLMGGDKKFTDKLQSVFDNNNYDPANEPDIAYPYLFSRVKGEEWRTQKIVKEMLEKHFKNKPDGIPGNDDTGTMSTWALFSMMGLYPDCPGVPEYTLTTPTFDEVEISLDSNYWNNEKITIKKEGNGIYIKEIKINGKKINKYRITHEELINAKEITFVTK